LQRVWVVVFVCVVACGSALAQVPKGNVFFGYSYENTPITSGDRGSLNGWDASLEGKVLPFLGLVVDVDGHYGSRDYTLPCPTGTCAIHADVAAHNVLLGPRASFQVGAFRPFAEVLVGAAHISRSNGISDSDTSFANAVGGGLDYRVAGPVSLRGQLDWIETRSYGNTQNGVRFSTGIAIHF
jgi:opacity protein-like surface antigen